MPDDPRAVLPLLVDADEFHLGTREALPSASGDQWHWTLCDRRVRSDQILTRFENFINQAARCNDCIEAIGERIAEITAARHRQKNRRRGANVFIAIAMPQKKKRNLSRNITEKSDDEALEFALSCR